MLKGLRIGLALTGSFCTFERVLTVLDGLLEEGAEVTPILSYHAASLDTRFGKAADFIRILEEKTGRAVIATIVTAEPIGPQGLFDILVVAPCTGNTLAKLAHSITDTPVTMAVKSHLRNQRPVLIGVSTNDGLAGSSENIGRLLAKKHYYFIPMGQDDPEKKPFSMVADMEKMPQSILSALKGQQPQPVLYGK